MARTRGKGWVADVSSPAGRRRFSGFPTRAKADAFKAQCLVAIEAGEALPVPDRETGAAAPYTLLDALRATSGNVWAHQTSPRVLNERRVESFAASLPQGLRTPMKELNRGQMVAWVSALKLMGNAPATINKKLAALAGLFSTARESGQIGFAPHLS